MVSNIRAYFDGSCILWRRASAGWVIYADVDGRTVHYSGHRRIDTDFPTCNVAEFSGLDGALRMIHDKFGPSDATIYGDSQVVIFRMQGKFKRPPKGHFVPFMNEAVSAEKLHKKITYSWIPRDQNAEADAMAAPRS